MHKINQKQNHWSGRGPCNGFCRLCCGLWYVASWMAYAISCTPPKSFARVWLQSCARRCPQRHAQQALHHCCRVPTGMLLTHQVGRLAAGGHLARIPSPYVLPRRAMHVPPRSVHPPWAAAVGGDPGRNCPPAGGVHDPHGTAGSCAVQARSMRCFRGWQCRGSGSWRGAGSHGW